MPTSRWPRVKLTEAASVQRGLLERETSGRVSVNSFIGQYIPVLNFPVDVTGAISKGEINLREATQLARLTPELLDATPARSRRLRSEVMLAHTLARGSQNALRTRIKEILGEVVTDSGKEMAGVVEKIDELLDIDPSDKRHLFYEELKWFFTHCGKPCPRTSMTIHSTNS